MRIDPRPCIIEPRLSNVKRIIAVTGWKGGIGKTVTSVTLALLLAKKGFKTGLFDLDVCGSCCHTALGVDNVLPQEDKGLIPLTISGVKFMSPAFFSSGKAVPLRGNQISDSIIEMFTVTRWDELDFLILDMPPGINDAALDILRYVPRAEILALSLPSVMSKNVLNRSLEMYKKLNVKVACVVENMTGGNDGIKQDNGLESALGQADKILKTQFANDVSNNVLKKLI